jgi:hypothetical protein
MLITTCFNFGIMCFVIAGLLKEEAVILEMTEKGVDLGQVTGGEVAKRGKKNLLGRGNQERTSVSKIGKPQSCIHLPKTCTSLIQL